MRLGALLEAAPALALPRPASGRAMACLLAVWWVACPVSRVTLSFHDTFAVSWASALSTGLVTLTPLPACSLSRLQSSDRSRDHQVRSRSRSGCSQSRRERSRSLGYRQFRRDRSRSRGSCYRSRGHGTGGLTGGLSPLTSPGHGRGAGGQDGVAGIVRRLLVPPRIAATLG